MNIKRMKKDDLVNLVEELRNQVNELKAATTEAKAEVPAEAPAEATEATEEAPEPVDCVYTLRINGVIERQWNARVTSPFGYRKAVAARETAAEQARAQAAGREPMRVTVAFSHA